MHLVLSWPLGCSVYSCGSIFFIYPKNSFISLFINSKNLNGNGKRERGKARGRGTARGGAIGKGRGKGRGGGKEEERRTHMSSISDGKLSYSLSAISSQNSFLTATTVFFFQIPLYTTPNPPWPILSVNSKSSHFTSPKFLIFHFLVNLLPF